MTSPKVWRLRSTQRALLSWHATHALRAPWRQSGDPYHCLVAAVMAQQTQMSRVMPSYERFVSTYPTLESLAAASLGNVIRVWAGMGYNQRAVRLHRAARQIAALGWPRDARALAGIDGIGPFTAAIIASFAFGQPAACVDTNVRRVIGRLTGDESMSGGELQRLADASIAIEAPAQWNQAVMDYGARVCTPRPKCRECVVRRWCASRARFEVAPRTAADERPAYRAAGRRSTPRPRYEQSDRYLRGRIIDVLRGLPPRSWITMRRLRAALANGATPPDDSTLNELVDALVAHGLAVRHRGRVSLPE